MVTRHPGLLLLWWMVLVALVSALLVFGWTNSVGAARPLTSPGLVTHAVSPLRPDWTLIPPARSEMNETWEAAVHAYRNGEMEEAARNMERLWNVEGEPRILDAGLDLWKVLVAHRAGDWETAESGWKTVALLPEMEVWRHLAATSLALRRHDYELAEAHWSMAAYEDADHPVVHYYLGLLYLNRAAHAHEWNDAIGPVVFRYAAYSPAANNAPAVTAPAGSPLPAVVPNSASMYRRAALEEFTLALDRELDRVYPLVGEEWTVEPELRPTVEDALLALGAERFVPNCHNVLGGMWTATGNAELAEEHFDRAYEMGAAVLYGYRDVADLYEEYGRHFDALRAYGKARDRGLTGADFEERVAESVSRAFLHGWLR